MMEPMMAISGKGEGRRRARPRMCGRGYKAFPRVPRARGRLDRPIIGALSTTTPDRNATSSDPEGLRVALLQLIRLGLGWDKFYNSEIANQAGGNIVVARNFRLDTR